jgi:hypothetical protein
MFYANVSKNVKNVFSILKIFIKYLLTICYSSLTTCQLMIMQNSHHVNDDKLFSLNSFNAMLIYV